MTKEQEIQHLLDALDYHVTKIMERVRKLEDTQHEMLAALDAHQRAITAINQVLVQYGKEIAR